MGRYIVSCAILAMLSSGAYARVGETIAQCTERYGEPVLTRPDGTGSIEVLFHRTEEPKSIVCSFPNRTSPCAEITYSRTDRAFTSDEVLSLGKLNSGSREGWLFEKTPTAPGKPVIEIWKCLSKGLVACGIDYGDSPFLAVVKFARVSDQKGTPFSGL